MAGSQLSKMAGKNLFRDVAEVVSHSTSKQGFPFRTRFFVIRRGRIISEPESRLSKNRISMLLLLCNNVLAQNLSNKLNDTLDKKVSILFATFQFYIRKCYVPSGNGNSVKLCTNNWMRPFV